MPLVSVVDDDVDSCELTCRLVSEMGHDVQVYQSAEEFRRANPPNAPHCLVLETELPRLSGLQMYGEMVRDGLRLPVIFTGADVSIATVVAAMKIGAIEFLEKPIQPRAMRTSIDRALKVGQTWLEREETFDDLQRRMSQLTARELETLQLVLDGASNKVIAARLLLSERAIELRRASIMRKLGARTASELATVAISHRLLAEMRDEL